MNVDAEMQRLNMEMNFQRIIDKLSEDSPDIEYDINHVIYLNDDSIAVQLLDNFMLIGEKQEDESYKAAAIGTIDASEGLTLMDIRVLQDQEMFIKALNRFNMIIDNHPKEETSQKLSGKYNHNEVVELVSDVWKQLMELKGQVIH